MKDGHLDQTGNTAGATPSSIGDLVMDYPGKVRVIRQSNRCLWAGILSILGIGLFARSLGLFVRAATATGEPWRWLPLTLFQIGSCIVAVAVAWQLKLKSGWHWSFLVIACTLLIQSAWVYWRYKTARPTHWNPARIQLYWGLALAHAGALMLYLILTTVLSTLAVRIADAVFFQR